MEIVPKTDALNVAQFEDMAFGVNLFRRLGNHTILMSRLKKTDGISQMIGQLNQGKIIEIVIMVVLVIFIEAEMVKNILEWRAINDHNKK